MENICLTFTPLNLTLVKNLGLPITLVLIKLQCKLIILTIHTSVCAVSAIVCRRALTSVLVSWMSLAGALVLTWIGSAWVICNKNK